MLFRSQLEAQAEVDFFSLQVQQNFRDAIGYVAENYQQTALPYGKPGTLDEITTPADKVDEYKLEAIEPTNESQIPNLTWYPSVLIYGAPGSGKSTFANGEIVKRKTAGHRVIVLDPHAAYGAWDGCEVVGGGMDYAGIDIKLSWFAEEVSRRYKRVQNELNPKFEPLTFVCDEFTRWGSKCSNSAEFFEQLVTDIRKVEMFGVIISHTRTLAGLANAKGFASLRDEALLEIEILGNLDEESGRATPRFEALIKLPGQSLRNRKLVKLVKLPIPKNAINDEASDTQINLSEEPAGTLWKLPTLCAKTPGTPYGIAGLDLEALLAEVLAEASIPIFSDDFTLLQSQ